MSFDIAEKKGLSRRRLLGGTVVLAGAGMLGGCSSTTGGSQGFVAGQGVGSRLPEIDFNQAYAATVDTEIPLPAFDYRKMDERYLRQWVKYNRSERPGTIMIDTSGPHLYLVQPRGRAVRYGIAVGREGFAWHGDAVMKWKQKWPTWTPPAEMIARTPELREFENGMPAGVNNPLGARAMYLYKDNRDTLFRIHGTNKPFSIGKAASSGCFRMVNQDVIDLYERVSPGAAVYVKPTLDDDPGR